MGALATGVPKVLEHVVRPSERDTKPGTCGLQFSNYCP